MGIFEERLGKRDLLNEDIRIMVVKLWCNVELDGIVQIHDYSHRYIT